MQYFTRLIDIAKNKKIVQVRFTLRQWKGNDIFICQSGREIVDPHIIHTILQTDIKKREKHHYIQRYFVVNNENEAKKLQFDDVER